MDSAYLIIPPTAAVIYGIILFIFENDKNKENLVDVVMINKLNLALVSFVVSVTVFIRNLSSNNKIQDFLTFSFIFSLCALLDVDPNEKDDKTIAYIKHGKMILTSFSLAFLFHCFYSIE